MSKRLSTRCDACNAVISTDSKTRITLGVIGVTSFYITSRGESRKIDSDLDFCNSSCLSRYMEKLANDHQPHAKRLEA